MLKATWALAREGSGINLLTRSVNSYSSVPGAAKPTQAASISTTVAALTAEHLRATIYLQARICQAATSSSRGSL